MNYLELAESYFFQTQADRRFLHQNTELAFEEFHTAEYVKSRLLDLGFTVESAIGGTGLVGSFDTGKLGKKAMFRFDMDALPIFEKNTHDFRSRNDGKMHACGHDGHVAIGLTLAQMLIDAKDDLRGSFHLLFQPAEEIGQGAIAMVQDGVLDKIQPDYILGVHLWNEKPLGWLGIVGGPLMAASSQFKIIINGKGGHGGQPQAANDPVVVLAQLINQLQTITSRNMDPQSAAVISVCKVQAGSSYNIIPSTAELGGTIRYLDHETYQLIRERLETICHHTGKAMNCSVELDLEELVAPTCNDAGIADQVRVAASQLEDDFVIDSTYKTMLSEDFGVFLERVSGCFILVGAGETPNGNIYPHHHPNFDFDEKAMPIASALLLQSNLNM
jgi:amidohydrolase